MAEFGFDPNKAVRHLKAADSALGEIMASVGPFAMELKSLRSLFGALAKAIVYQQLSNKAAATIYGRVEALFPRAKDGVTPRHIPARPTRHCGAAACRAPRCWRCRIWPAGFRAASCRASTRPTPLPMPS
ncbi:hypothetical protein [Reyranella sp.]|uniref:hypothetical protein n=1 Tax=Reyranella sp. TaxID=1929291 RepID=UPI003D09C684